MSTIAIDSTGLVAFDSQSTNGSYAIYGDVPKVQHFRGFGLVGVTGSAGMVPRVYEWLSDGAKERDTPSGDFLAVWIDYNLDVRLYDSDNKGTYVTVKGPYALGSGGQYAMGAMAAGMNAREAVNIARSLDLFTGGEIKTIDMQEIIREQAAAERQRPQYKPGDTVTLTPSGYPGGWLVNNDGDVVGGSTVTGPNGMGWTGAE